MSTVKAPQNQPFAPSGTGVEIRLLRPMTVQIDGQAVTLAAKKVRGLLAYLVQREGVEVARTVLTGLLWGERGEAQARASLRQSLSKLRAALGEAADALIANKESVTWKAGAAWLDTKALELAAKSDDDNLLRAATALYGGDFLEGLAIDELPFDQWLVSERAKAHAAHPGRSADQKATPARAAQPLPYHDIPACPRNPIKCQQTGFVAVWQDGQIRFSSSL